MLRFFCILTKCCRLMIFSVPNTEDDEEKEKVKKAAECCKKILYHVNQAVKEAENRRVKFRFHSFLIQTCFNGAHTNLLTRPFPDRG